jgi:hypothetical protein
MATVTSRRSIDRSESRQRVAHPLDRLRSTIRKYVIIEGLAVVGIYLALWFWLGLIFDFGFFKLFTIDWVQELPAGFRLGVLVLVTLGVLGVVLYHGYRLAREFRPAALALVLERRFPRILGDRLITAVELADPRVAEKYGYSQTMIDETIAEAAERVEQIPLTDAFKWSRLRRLWTMILVLTIGVYLLTGIGYCAVTRTTDVGGFFGQFNDVAAIWFERNILLHDTIWPRKAHLELIDFPGDSIRVGRDAQPPTLRVRALKWVIADSNRTRAPEGWRALRWQDINEALLGEPVPNFELPDDWRELTVDQIELRMEKPGGAKELSDATASGLGSFFEKLAARTASPSMSRRLRKLIVPAGVEVLYKGKTSRSEQTLPPGVNHEFSGAVANLRESLQFTVRGEDYYTPAKRIIVVPPPVLMELAIDEAQPAYIHQLAPSDGRPADLKGKRQRFDSRPVSLTGERSLIPIPAGSDLTLTGKVDKPLKADGLRVLPGKPGALPVIVSLSQTNPQAFELGFTGVTGVVDFVIEFTDTDEVVGRRRVEIRPALDTVPEVDVQVEVMRKVNQAYMVTPQALVPFSGKVRDDRGLNDVNYVYTSERVEEGVDARMQLARLLGASAVAAVSPELTLAYVALLTRVAQPVVDSGDKDARAEPLATFQMLWNNQKSKAVPASRLAELLAKSPSGSLLKMFDLDPEMEVFNVGKVGLRMDAETGTPPRYRLRLGVAATDNNIETGPGVGQSKEKFTFLVVSENELLAEIAKEEEGLHFKLEEAVNRLKDAKAKLDKLAQELPELKADEFSPMARRTEELLDASSRSADTTREVLSDYRRILKELRANQVRANNRIDTVSDKICDPLEAAVNVDFIQSDDALRALHKQLEEKSSDRTATLAQQHLKTLIDRLSGVLDHMGEITNFNAVLRMAIEIEKGEREQHEGLKRVYEAKVKSILEGLDDPAKPVDK